MKTVSLDLNCMTNHRKMLFGAADTMETFGLSYFLLTVALM